MEERTTEAEEEEGGSCSLNFPPLEGERLWVRRGRRFFRSPVAGGSNDPYHHQKKANGLGNHFYYRRHKTVCVCVAFTKLTALVVVPSDDDNVVKVVVVGRGEGRQGHQEEEGEDAIHDDVLLGVAANECRERGEGRRLLFVSSPRWRAHVPMQPSLDRPNSLSRATRTMQAGGKCRSFYLFVPAYIFSPLSARSPAKDETKLSKSWAIRKFIYHTPPRFHIGNILVRMYIQYFIR